MHRQIEIFHLVGLNLIRSDRKFLSGRIKFKYLGDCQYHTYRTLLITIVYMLKMEDFR
jgi:hypothetical protein